MKDFFQRLEIFMKHSYLNDNRITVDTGISNGLIGKARRRGSLSQESISKILLKYRNLNARWLLTGEGEMLNDDFSKSKSDLEQAYRNLLSEKDKKIDQLNREIGRLEFKLDELLKGKDCD